MTVTVLVVTACIGGVTSLASAQVGYPPNRSPHRDRDYNREWTYFGGQFSAERDPVGVAPTDGPMAGVRWQMHLTGPLYFGVRLAGASVERRIIDPAKRLDERMEVASGRAYDVPLDVCVAQSQGETGYLIERTLREEFARRGVSHQNATRRRPNGYSYQGVCRRKVA